MPAVAVLVPELVRACHPEPTLAVTVIAGALAAGAGAPVGRVGAAFLAGQLTTGWSNDWIDRDRDRATGRLDKPVAAGRLAPAALRRAALLAGTACVPLSLRLGRRAGAAHLVAVCSALSYNAGLKAGPLSPAPYAVSFGLLPSIVTLAAPGARPAAAWATATGALLGTGAHLANTLPDLEADEATGVRGLPHRLGRRASTRLMAGLLLGATVALCAGPDRPGLPDAAALAAAALLTGRAVVLASRPGSRAAFLAALAVAGVDVTLLVARGAALSGG